MLAKTKSLKQMSERVEIKKDGNGIVIFISGKMKKWHESLLFGWLVIWALCGFYVMAFLFQELSFEEKMFLLAYLAFWGYFEYMAARAWIWRKKGMEILKLGDGNLHMQNNLPTFGSPKSYFLENIKNLGIIQREENSFSSSYFSSFWIIGGETISFEYFDKTVILGKQLSREDSQKVLTALRKFLKRKK